MNTNSIANCTPTTLSKVIKAVQSCRLCGRLFHDYDDLIGIYTEEGRKLRIAPKIFYTLSIMIIESDPTSNYVCKVCCGHLECSFKFAWSCRTKNYDIVKNSINVSFHNTYQEEMKKMLKIPFQSVYFKSSISPNEGYDLVANHIKNPEANTKLFIHELEEKVLNEFGRKKATNNGYIQIGQIPSSVHLNMPFTNKSNINKNTSENVVPSNTNTIPRITILNRNKIVSNGPTILNNTNNDSNLNSAQSSVNGTNASESDEVICVDDDDDNDGNNDNNDQQVDETNENHLNMWVVDNNNTVQKSQVSINQAKKTLQTKRKLVPIDFLSMNQNTSSKRTTNQHSSVSNVASEDVTITPDMPLLNIDAVSPFNQTENYYGEEVSPSTNNQLLFTPETGIHFLVEPRDTVDLTVGENSKKKRGRKRKNDNDVEKSPPAKKICQRIPIASENKEENHQSLSELSSETIVEPSTTAAKNKICQGIPIASENEEKNHQSLSELSSETIVEPSTTAAKNKICQGIPIASENEEGNNQSLSELSSETIVEPSTTATQKEICQRILIASENEEENKQSLLELSSETFVKPRTPAAKKKIYQKIVIAPKNKKENSQLISELSSEIFVKPRIPAAKKPVATPKRFSKRLLYKPVVKPPGHKRVLNDSSIIATATTTTITTTTTVNALNKYSNLLGKHVAGNWDIKLSHLELPKYKCPICDSYFHTIRSRQNHETLTHFLPLEFPPPSDESVQESENTTSTEQQEFLLYLNLVKKVPLRQKTMDILASRPNVLKSLRIVGNTIDSYNCYHCEYKTTRLFILWAHITSCHNEPIVEKKSSPFCFLCNRYLNKRIKLLKHVDQCINRLAREKAVDPPPTKHFTCDICHNNFNSSSDLEKHFYNHVAIMRQNKKDN